MNTTIKNLPAPAKLNLFLHVTGRREDGYHLLESVFVLIDLADSLDIERLETGEIERTGDVIGEKSSDLCVRAAQELAQATGCKLGARIHVKKRIPAGAGLGGGSSDAATTLMALNQLWSLNLSRQQLMAIGARIGADVPFFLFGRNAFARGIGDKLTPIQTPESFAAIAMPPSPTPTRLIYTSRHLTRNTPSVQEEDFLLFTEKNWPSLFGRNDLQSVAEQINPEISTALTLLGKGSRMTGSGSAVFIPAESREKAQSILLHLPSSYRGYVAKILPVHPLYRDTVG